jgi:cytochrome b
MTHDSDWEARRVYDPVLRFMHAWNALALIALLATGWLADVFERGPNEALLWKAHILLGYGLIVGLVTRALWGVVGPRHARFSDMWHPRVWIDVVRNRMIRASRRFGHNELASLAYLGVYALILAMGATGLALAAIEHGVGPLSEWLGDATWLKKIFKEPHEAISTVLALFVGVHLIALVVHEWLERNHLAGSMLTGIQYRRREQHDHG